LYRDRAGVYQVGVCIQRMKLTRPLEEFLASGLLAEIRGLRESEMTTITARIGGSAAGRHSDEE
jgi:GTP 3',8-cyclase